MRREAHGFELRARRRRRGGLIAVVGVGVVFVRLDGGRRPVEEGGEVPVAAAAVLNPGLRRIERSHAVVQLSQQLLLHSE